MWKRLHVKYPLLLSDFIETWIFSTDFRKMLNYQVSSKSVHWEPSCFMRTERRTDWHDEANSRVEQVRELSASRSRCTLGSHCSRSWPVPPCKCMSLLAVIRLSTSLLWITEVIEVPQPFAMLYTCWLCHFASFSSLPDVNDKIHLSPKLRMSWAPILLPSVCLHSVFCKLLPIFSSCGILVSVKPSKIFPIFNTSPFHSVLYSVLHTVILYYSFSSSYLETISL